MRAITPPILDPKMLYETCINSISDLTLQTRLNNILNNIIQSSIDYQQKATDKTLYTIAPNHCNNDDIALGSVTKKELRDIYSLHMVPAKKPARQFYDSLILLAPLGRCPYCAVGYASTLDHYLPKHKFPQLSVTPLNLIPSCKDCNTGTKRTAFSTTPTSQTLHPYFDHQSFIDEQWLYATVLETTPAVIQFFVQPPDHWDDISKARVQSHFNDFALFSRYSIEASNQLACLRGTLIFTWNTSGFTGVRLQLMIDALGYFQQHKNSWQTAMYQALAKSEWYCNGGFR